MTQLADLARVTGLAHAATATGTAVAVGAGLLAALSWVAMVVAFGRLARAGRLRRRWLVLGAVPVLNLGLLLVLLDDDWLAPPPADDARTPPGAFATYLH